MVIRQDLMYSVKCDCGKMVEFYLLDEQPNLRIAHLDSTVLWFETKESMSSWEQARRVLCAIDEEFNDWVWKAGEHGFRWSME